MTVRCQLLLALAVLTVSPTSAQQFLFADPGNIYNVTSDALPAERVVRNDRSKAARNSAAINAAFQKVGARHGGIHAPLYFPAGRYYVTGVTVPGGSGGQLLTGGGLSHSLTTAHQGKALKATTRLVLDRSAQGGNVLTYQGNHWFMGPMEIWGFDLNVRKDYVDRANRPKAAAGFLVQDGNPGGAPTGKLFASVYFVGCESAVKVVGDQGDNCDNLTWDYLAWETCTTGYHVVCPQSVTHLVQKAFVGWGVNRAFYFESGGDLHVRSLQVNGARCTVLELGSHYHPNFGNYEIRNIKFDNMADDFTLLKLPRYSGTPRPVILTGSLGGSVSFNPQTVIQGVDRRDKVWIAFTGPGSETLNAFSTVAAPPF